MDKTLYRVGEGANLSAFPRGTKVGDAVALTEAQAMYERDMGRIVPVSDERPEQPVPGETRGHPVDAVSGEPLKLTDEERARLPEIGIADPSEPAVRGEADAPSATRTLTDEIDRIEPEAGADPVGLKPRRGR